MSGLPRHVEEAIHHHLDSIAAFWKPGTKLTLIVRPCLGDDRDADAVISNDELPAAIAALQRRYEKSCS